jgi:hypothetical protein
VAGAGNLGLPSADPHVTTAGPEAWRTWPRGTLAAPPATQARRGHGCPGGRYAQNPLNGWAALSFWATISSAVGLPFIALAMASIVA